MFQDLKLYTRQQPQTTKKILLLHKVDGDTDQFLRFPLLNLYIVQYRYSTDSTVQTEYSTDCFQDEGATLKRVDPYNNIDLYDVSQVTSDKKEALFNFFFIC